MKIVSTFIYILCYCLRDSRAWHRHADELRVTAHESICWGCVSWLVHAGKGKCSPGYFCNDTSSVPYQHLCPAGHYCTEGSAIPTECPPGTFASSTKNRALMDCQNCTAGRFCQGRTFALCPRVLLTILLPILSQDWSKLRQSSFQNYKEFPSLAIFSPVLYI